ncbi:MAG: hypothetical protein JXA71_00980 [Chitinispirillaceae bacterium]|nr:hypothetical protein [Chitinispirillaceae bacterium]
MHDHLTLGGWFFLIAVWTGILALNVFCFRNIFREKEEEIAEPVAELEKTESRE